MKTYTLKTNTEKVDLTKGLTIERLISMSNSLDAFNRLGKLNITPQERKEILSRATHNGSHAFTVK